MNRRSSSRARQVTPSRRAGGTQSRYPRTARVNELLREVVADELERHTDEDARLELVTITGVNTDPDLRRAKVFFSALDDAAPTDDIVAAFEARRVEMQALIGRSVRMKRTPHLEFLPDPAISEGLKVERLLRDLHNDGD